MKRMWVAIAVAAALLLTGCSASGTPKAVTPLTTHDFGDVPVTDDMKNVRRQEFVIRNDGTGDLKLSNLQVKLLQGC